MNPTPLSAEKERERETEKDQPFSVKIAGAQYLTLPTIGPMGPTGGGTVSSRDWGPG